MATTNLMERLEQAECAFTDAENSLQERGSKETPRCDTEKVPRHLKKHFDTLGLAIYVLDTYTKEELEAFTRDWTVHPSTIAGGSLYIARKTYERYASLSSESLRTLSTDNYEQLTRVCQGARTILERRAVLGKRLEEHS